ncbi:hypothetical protein P7K49_007889 [Saguinus oedipus]|uniref:Copine C-terminal domain-containing protein n=1 Tax=Saguinus oedipus TaxID=9490 RepID=A0ABQ9VW45_SAGOE|nr:hypothetical protein P7K49_007889 [Saguinus oedipus]
MKWIPGAMWSVPSSGRPGPCGGDCAGRPFPRLPRTGDTQAQQTSLPCLGVQGTVLGPVRMRWISHNTFLRCSDPNGNQENPSCCGIDGILEAYHRSLRTVQLYGPTNFAPVVTHVASVPRDPSDRPQPAPAPHRNAAAVQDGSQYSVLLIITDGVISDMAQTKEAIVNAAKLPMSIIIVGVGQAEFDGESSYSPPLLSYPSHPPPAYVSPEAPGPWE